MYRDAQLRCVYTLIQFELFTKYLQITLLSRSTRTPEDRARWATTNLMDPWRQKISKNLFLISWRTFNLVFGQPRVRTIITCTTYITRTAYIICTLNIQILEEKARAILKRFFVSDLLGPRLSLGKLSGWLWRVDLPLLAFQKLSVYTNGYYLHC